MANSTHTHEMQTTQTKDFDFVEEQVIARYFASYKGFTPTEQAALPKSSVFDQESLSIFHEEFKRLVLASDQADLEQADWEAAQLLAAIEPHEIEWMNWLADDVAPIAETQPEMQSVARRQVIKPLAGPPLGTPPPVEIWVVKAIGALICLNLLFAGLIVSGLKVNDWLKWLTA